jgi:VIT1/CCC1 family predicted Fe2+/Mn2+ transporter
LLPVLPYLLGANTVLISGVVSVVGLFVAGAITSRFTVRGWAYSGSRQLLLGAFAAAITYAAGLLFHVSVS